MFASEPAEDAANALIKHIQYDSLQDDLSLICVAITRNDCEGGIRAICLSSSASDAVRGEIRSIITVSVRAEDGNTDGIRAGRSDRPTNKTCIRQEHGRTVSLGLP